MPWDRDKPAAGIQARYLDDQCRDNFGYIEDTLEEDHDFLDTGHHKKAVLLEQVADPVTAAGEVTIYSKDDGDGNVELYVRGESNATAIKLTEGGRVAGTEASSAATAGLLVVRDANGRAQVAAPSADADIARKDTIAAQFTRTVYTAGGSFGGSNNVIIATDPVMVSMVWAQMSHDTASTRTSAAIIPSALRPTHSFTQVFGNSGKNLFKIQINTNGTFTISYTDVSTGLPHDAASAQAGSISWPRFS